MDDDAEIPVLTGRRLKWRRTGLSDSARDSFWVDSSDVPHVVAGLESTVQVSEQCPDSHENGNDKALEDTIETSGLDLNSDGYATQYEPSIAPSFQLAAETVDVGGVSTVSDDNAFIVDQRIRGARMSGLTLPWETPLMSQIFGSLGPSMNLSMPLDWGSTGLPSTSPMAVEISEPVIPSECRWACSVYVKHKSDATYLEQREKNLHGAIEKWRFLVMIDPHCSEVGRQLVMEDESEHSVVLSSVMGVKSPNTVMKRANAIMMYYRWHAVSCTTPFLPFREPDLWRYVLAQQSEQSSTSRSQSLVQALRFCHYVLGFDCALQCANSRRIVGQSHIQLSLRAPSEQARALTVDEMKKLHAIADGTTHSDVDRCIASNILLGVYGRCRVSDMNFVHEILHDITSGAGYLEVTTRYHKSARTAQQKAFLLPIVMSCAGVVSFPWVHSWISNRKACGLPTAGLVDGALMPAPSLGDKVTWLSRPLSPMEVTDILRGFLESSDASLTSHSMKATTLSWSAKAEMPREQRRILGRHSSTVQDSDSCYSRDMSIGPVNSLKKVIEMVRDGTFCPDAKRSNYFTGSTTRAGGTPSHVVMQPFTPAFLERQQPGTPGMEKTMEASKPAEEGTDHGAEREVEFKTEDGWNLLEPGSLAEPIEVSSDDETDSSDSDTCDGTSGEDEPMDLDEVLTEKSKEHRNSKPLEPQLLVKNVKTKVVHELRDQILGDVQSADELTRLAMGQLTKCGKLVTKHYGPAVVPLDWTAKCRVCFHGRRAPN